MTTAQRPKRSPRLTPVQLEHLRKLREAHPRWSAYRLGDELEAFCGVRPSETQLYKALNRMGLGGHRPSGRRNPRTGATRRPIAKSTKPYAAAPDELPLPPPHRRSYPTDLTDREWDILAPLIPSVLPGGRPEKIPRREIVNAMFYVLRTGCTWRALPHDFPSWKTVYWYFQKWRDSGLWQRINDALRPMVRVRAGRKDSPSAAILDSQSVKTTEKGGPEATTAPSA
jgi:transposase